MIGRRPLGVCIPVLFALTVLGSTALQAQQPPPLPPPNVPPLEEKKANEKLLSLRERIVEHRANRVCATCHNLIDPVGFALENYDAIGRWRTEDGGFPVDATGSLPDGSEFDGVSELQEILLQRPEIFVGTLAGKLLTYSLGRGLPSA